MSQDEQQDEIASSFGSRETAKRSIAERIKRLRQEAAYLAVLLETLPDDMPKEADEALWRLVCGYRH